MKSTAVALLAAYAAGSEMFHTRNPVYGYKPSPKKSYSSYPVHVPHMPQGSHALAGKYGYHNIKNPVTVGRTEYGKGYSYSAYGKGNHYDRSKFLTPLEKLEIKVDQNKKEVDERINQLETVLSNRIADLEADSVRLALDYFFVNEDRIELGNQNDTFITIPDPGEFCVEAGQTVEMVSNVSINNQSAGVTTLEILRNDTDTVALAAFWDDFALAVSNGSVYYRETVSETTQFEFRIRLQNLSRRNDRIQINSLQNSVRIYNNPQSLATTDAPIGGCPEPVVI